MRRLTVRTQSKSTPAPALYLLDTNVLLRLSERASPMHATAKQAVANIYHAGGVPLITAQNLIEFWTVATRPPAANGLGLTAAQTVVELVRHKAAFRLLPDTPDILPRWESLAARYNVRGAQAHDARLAAVALAYQVPNFLTFNGKHFTRFAPAGLVVIDPAQIPNPQT